MSNDSHFVSPHGDDWSVQRSNSERPSHVFNTQREAINIAKPIASNQGGDVIIHRRNGQIRERNSYGNDPFPPKG